MKQIFHTLFFLLVAVCLNAQGAVVLPSSQHSNRAYVPSVTNNESDYMEGWKEGYKDGYCYQDYYGCYAPMPPYPPLPRIGEDNYKGGYNRGFLRGKADKEDE